MSMEWWDLPGPSRFVQRVENNLKDKVNVVAAFPQGLGRDWFGYFQRRWRFNQNRIEVLYPEDSASAPLDFLCELFTNNREGTTTIGALIQESAFHDLTVGIFLQDRKDIAAWRDFLALYERECRLVDELDRTVFLVVTDGVLQHDLPSAEMLLRILAYDGYARPHDCYMYAWTLLGDDGRRHSWLKEMKLSLCAQLAQWDHRLCEQLSMQELGGVLNKESIADALPDVVCTDVNKDPDAGWAMGVLQNLDNEIVYHSGWEARDVSSKEYVRRIWTAQIQVVFPLIEQVRREALSKYRHLIHFPVRVGDVDVNDPYELEIAMVASILRCKREIPRRTIRKLEKAWEFRNALAHLEPLSAGQLLEFDQMLCD